MIFAKRIITLKSNDNSSEREIKLWSSKPKLINILHDQIESLKVCESINILSKLSEFGFDENDPIKFKDVELGVPIYEFIDEHFDTSIDCYTVELKYKLNNTCEVYTRSNVDRRYKGCVSIYKDYILTDTIEELIPTLDDLNNESIVDVIKYIDYVKNNLDLKM